MQFEILWQAFCDVAAAQNIVSVFLRLHPLLPLPAKPLKDLGRLVQHGQTVYLNLNNPEEVDSGICRNHRRDIKKLTQNGFQFVVDEWSHYPRFIEIYRATMTRLHADSKYYFEGDYFSRLRQALGDDLHLAVVVAPSGEIAAGEIFTTTCGIVQNHLAGAADEYQHLAPTKLLTDHMRRWAQERGERLFHMGGGFGGCEDSLFRFKAGFSKLRADFFTYRMILNSEKYQQLAARWHQIGRQGGEDDNFFPAYRRPRA
jgi:lipid II:glycine glycyltransferase (peptidoglycan interpeptide bridge formation enzyme)